MLSSLAKLLPATDPDDDDDQGTELLINADMSWTPEDVQDVQEIFGVMPTDIQESIMVDNLGAKITGTSKYLDSVDTFDMDLGHHFLLLHIWANGADKIEASMNPSQTSGLVELDASGVVLFQMKDDKSQTVKIVATKDGEETVREFSIADMTFAAEEVQENEPGE